MSVIIQASPLRIGQVFVSGGSLIFSGSGGTTNGTFYVLTSTNITTPLADWVPLSTNMYDGSGNFSSTNSINLGDPHRFYMIQQ